MRTMRIVLVLLLIFFGIYGCQAWAMGLEAAVNIWDQKPDGDLSYQAFGTQDRIDLEQEAGYGHESKIGGRLKLELPTPALPNIYVLATPMEFSGTGLKSVDFSFGGGNFSANTAFTSKITLDHYDLGLYYTIPLLNSATLNTLNVDLGIGLRRLEVRGDASQVLTGVSASVDETYYFPMAFLGIQVRILDSLAVEAELRGIAYSSNHFYDVIGRLKYGFGPVFLAGGYRYEEVELNESDIRADVNVGGPYAEAGVRF